MASINPPKVVAHKGLGIHTALGGQGALGGQVTATAIAFGTIKTVIMSEKRNIFNKLSLIVLLISGL